MGSNIEVDCFFIGKILMDMAYRHSQESGIEMLVLCFPRFFFITMFSLKSDSLIPYENIYDMSQHSSKQNIPILSLSSVFGFLFLATIL